MKIKKIIFPLFIALLVLLTIKFIMWNTWKVERALNLGKDILHSPSAVNFSFFQENRLIYKKGFTSNDKGHYYIINQLDISPYVDNHLLRLDSLRINDKIPPNARLYQFKHFYAIKADNQYFFFPNNHIEDLLHIKNNALSIVSTIEAIQQGSQSPENISETLISMSLLK